MRRLYGAGPTYGPHRRIRYCAAMAEFEQILVEQVGDVVRITLNRPERLNAWKPTMLGEMVQVITSGNEDASVGTFVVTGAGRGFCAGSDIGSQFAPCVEG